MSLAAMTANNPLQPAGCAAEPNDPNTTIRSFRDQDEAAVIAVWHRAGQAAYKFLPSWQTLTLERAGEIFREVIVPRCNIWVGTRDHEVVAFLAMNGSYIDRIFVVPAEWRKGWGTRLLVFAKALFPDGLELHTTRRTILRGSYTRSTGLGL